MKKLMLSLAALAMIAVGCEKNDGPNVIESSKKSIEISIVNGVADNGTKAVEEVTPTPAGGAGDIQTKEDNQAAAKTSDLTVLFANNAGNIIESYSFADATAVEDEDGKWNYRFHGVHESVTQVAVVRHEKPTNGFEGTNLSVYAEAAAQETIVADLDALNLYGSSDISWDGQTTCTVEDAVHNTKYTYNLYTAEVDVIPTLARVEIEAISCTDLGETTFAASTDPTITGGFDEMILKNIVFGGDNEYTYTFKTDDVLKGVYKDETEADRTTKRDLVSYSPGEENVIAWNIAPSVAYPSDNAPMILTLEASAYDYDVNTPEKTLTINGLTGATQFERSKIYRLSINFKESNLDESNEAICVDVTVKIANWVVVEVNPTFAN